VAAVWLALASATAPQAEPFPALYDVTGVAPGDVLNIRDAPGTQGQIFDRFRPEETGIEVVRADVSERWARVRMGEIMGWASLAFLERQPAGQGFSDPPQALSCGGTEPFWSLSIAAGKGGRYGGEFINFATMEVPEEVSMEAPQAAPNDLRQLGSFGRRVSEAAPLTLGLSRQLCSDGMSDVEFGFSALVIATAESGTQVLGGCCSLR